MSFVVRTSGSVGALGGNPQSDPAVNLPHQPLGATAQGDEVNPQSVELVEFGVGRQPGIEDQFLGIPPRSFRPKSGEMKDLFISRPLLWPDNSSRSDRASVENRLK